MGGLASVSTGSFSTDHTPKPMALLGTDPPVSVCRMLIGQYHEPRIAGGGR